MKMSSDPLTASTPPARDLRDARSVQAHARWGEAAALTAGLWLFVIVLFLPIMFERGWHGVAAEASTALVSALLALALFALFRATLPLPFSWRAALLIAGIAAAAAVQLRYGDIFASGGVGPSKMPSKLVQAGYGTAMSCFGVLFVNVACFQALFAIRRSAARERVRIEAREGAQEAQLAAVRAQMDPHFLFNTLNSISSLIVTRRNDDAEEMTLKLAGFLRTSLACQPSELVRVDAELALIEQYLEIEAVRFAKKLLVEFDLDAAAADRLVPAFLIQPLIENAVKHGVAPAKRPVRIGIAAAMDSTTLRLTVENDRVEATAGCLGVGLVNLKRRLETIYGAAAALDIEASAERFKATIAIEARLTQPADMLIHVEPIVPGEKAADGGPVPLAN